MHARICVSMALQDCDQEACLVVGDGNFSFAAGLCKVNHYQWTHCACSCGRPLQSPDDSESGSERDEPHTVCVCARSDRARTHGASCSSGSPPRHESSRGYGRDVDDDDDSSEVAAVPAPVRAGGEAAVRHTAARADWHWEYGVAVRFCCPHCCLWYAETQRQAGMPSVWRNIDTVVATSFEVEAAVRGRRGAVRHMETMGDLGVELLFAVDATRLEAHPDLGPRRFSRVVFNYPHSGDKRDKIDKCRQLLRDFFASASRMLDRHPTSWYRKAAAADAAASNAEVSAKCCESLDCLASSSPPMTSSPAPGDERFARKPPLGNARVASDSCSPATAPGTDIPSPGTDNPSPGTDIPSPGTQSQVPWCAVLETETPPPGCEAEPNIRRTDVTVGGNDFPVGRPVFSNGGSDYPAGGSDYPADGTDHPADGTDHPADGTDHPADGTDHPTDGPDYPTDGTDHPTDGPDYPTDGPDYAGDGAERDVPRCFPQISVLLMPGQGGTPVDGNKRRIHANHWQAVEAAAAAGLMLCSVRRLDTLAVVPGYARTGLASRDADFGGDVGVLHVFTPRLRAVRWGPRRFPAAAVAVDDANQELSAAMEGRLSLGGYSVECGGRAVHADGAERHDVTDENADRRRESQSAVADATTTCGSARPDTAAECAGAQPACVACCPTCCGSHALRSLYPPVYEQHISFWLPAKGKSLPVVTMSSDPNASGVTSSDPIAHGVKSSDLNACGVLSSRAVGSDSSEQCNGGAVHSELPVVLERSVLERAVRLNVPEQLLRAWCRVFSVVAVSVCGETLRHLKLFDVYRNAEHDVSLTFSMTYQSVGLSVLSWEDCCACQERVRDVTAERLGAVVR